VKTERDKLKLMLKLKREERGEKREGRREK
jgi:hypothetical protein